MTAITRPQLRPCEHPAPKQANGREVHAFRVWIGKYKIGTVYQNHPRGKWFAVNVTGNSSKVPYGSSTAAIQYLSGQFELYKPKRGDVEAEKKSPFLKYNNDDQPPTQ